MARNEEGEFELILGNRQLLSVFFIVVVLLGLCFLMGYVIGRNSAPVVNAENIDTGSGSGEPLVIPPAESPAPAAETRESPVQTAPQANPETAALPSPKPPPSQPVPPPAAKQETKQGKLPPLPPAPGGPAAGAYLQLSATERAEAEAYVDRLRGKGFTATLAPAPTGNRFRVLVGPFSDSPAEFQRVRDRLNSQGFPGKEALDRRY